MDIKDFLPNDQEQAIKEINCAVYCSKVANVHFNNGNYAEALTYLENANRSLKELDKLKNKKLEQDSWLIIKRGEAQLFVDTQIIMMRSKAHEKSR